MSSEENLQIKKASILKYVNVGLGTDTAYTLAGVSDTEKEELAADLSFQEFLKAGSATLEYELLQNVHKAMLINIRSGKSEDARWLLGVVNPGRYAGRKEVAVGANGSVTIKIGEEYSGV